MRKIKVVLMLMVMCAAFLLYGCKKEEVIQQENRQEKEEYDQKGPVQDNQEETEGTEENVSEDSKDNGVTNTVTVTNMKIYYADPGTGEILGKDIEGSNVTPEMIWEQLKKEGVIAAECGLNQFTFHDAEKKIDIDVDDAFGSYIRGMGTSGENITITCITRSYLETYGYEGIKITEDGKVLETGHAVLDGYMGLE